MSEDGFLPADGPQWARSRGNVRRFIEETALPPLSEDHQRAAGMAAAETALQETFGRQAVAAGGQRVTEPDPDIPQHATAAAFFDVDNTLIQGNSLIALGYQLYRQKFFSLREIFPYMVAQMRYRTFGSELPDAIAQGRETALNFIKGRRSAELTALCADLVDAHLMNRTYSGTHDLAAMHIAAGEQVWLVSATPVQVGQMLAERLGFTGALGTVAEEENGVFTGRLIGDILHGPGKTHAVKALADVQGLDLAECTAYSDSANDIPMLSMVGTPVAINPDRALRKHAQKNGWLIRDYRSVRRVVTGKWAPVAAAAALAGAVLWCKRAR